MARCWASANVLGNTSVGGLLGLNNSTVVTGCYATGSVTGGDSVGGLIGDNDTAVMNCYATGSVTGGSYGYAGGLVGNNGATITNCYSTGKVAGIANARGLVGYSQDPVSVVACFWDLQASGQTASDGGLGKTTAQMQMASTFLAWAAAGNEGVWTIDEVKDYPRLWWENRPGEAIRLVALRGAGTKADPYLIHTAEELNRVGAMVGDLNKCFKLMADIDLSGFGGGAFNMIGDEASSFKGVFDGNGHSIANFSYAAQGVSGVGLFGIVSDPNARIMNLRLTDPNVSVQAGEFVGSLVGHLVQGTLVDCHVQKGRVVGGNSVGGLIGGSKGMLIGCSASGTVLGNTGVGGLIGSAMGEVIRCSSECSVLGDWSLGGLAGESYATVTACYSAGPVSGYSKPVTPRGNDGGGTGPRRGSPQPHRHRHGCRGSGGHEWRPDCGLLRDRQSRRP